jgi:hypothetical protein
LKRGQVGCLLLVPGSGAAALEELVSQQQSAQVDAPHPRGYLEASFSQAVNVAETFDATA